MPVRQAAHDERIGESWVDLQGPVVILDCEIVIALIRVHLAATIESLRIDQIDPNA
jgi:hypothetical protein